MDLDLVGAIYEAGAIPERWPRLIDRIAFDVGAKGGILMCAKRANALRMASPGIAPVVDAFEAGGWTEGNTRVSRLVGHPPHPGFLTDADLHSKAELESLPMYVEFLTPHGVAAGAATVIQGVASDGLVMTFEGFASQEAARRAVPALDALRPHLARAATLSGQLWLEHARSAIVALDLIGTAASMIDDHGRLMLANRSFEDLLGTMFNDTPARLRLADRHADAALLRSLADLRSDGVGRSIALRDGEARRAAVLHLLPLRGDARELFAGGAALAVLAGRGNALLPTSDLLQALFDLTPAEARIARGIGESRSLRDLAGEQQSSVETVRSHLKRVFQKTGLQRQVELASMVQRLWSPEPVPDE